MNTINLAPNMRLATVLENPVVQDAPSAVDSAVHEETGVSLDTESFRAASIRMYTAPEHRHTSDVALLQIGISFFSGLKSFMEEAEKTPEARMGFRASPQKKLDIGECLIKAKVVSNFSTDYVFTVDAPTQEDAMKRKIALDFASVAEGFSRAVKSVTQDVLITKDTAGFLSGMFAETTEAMRILVTQLSMTILGGQMTAQIADNN